jgi:CheY-like chemotaxis protein
VRSRIDNQRTVLVVDDHPDLRLSLQRLLERAGYHVLEAGNGAEGLEQLRRARVDVVVLDIDMPVMNGRAFLAARTADPDLSRVPVVVYSADPQPARLPAGVVAWIWKGTESAELLAAIGADRSR